MLQLTKHHGLGNDFLVALAEHNVGLDPDPAVTARLCDRRVGVGADGVIFALEPAEHGHDAHMVLLNADGSEAEISGNGIRCLAQAMLRARGVDEARLLVETPGGVRQVRTVRGRADGELWVQVDMGAASPGPDLGARSAAYPARRRSTVDVGNPHLVLEVMDPSAVDLGVDGPALESEYSAGINVQFVSIEASDSIRLAVWERGAGITRACGSGAVAAAVAAHDWGAVGDRVVVHMPGGDAVVERAGSTLLLTGPTVFVAEVRAPQHPPERS